MFERSNLFVFFPALKVAFSVASLLIQIDCLDKLIWPQAIKAPQSISKPFALISNIFLVNHAIIHFLGRRHSAKHANISQKGHFSSTRPVNARKFPRFGVFNFLKLCVVPEMCLHLNFPSLAGFSWWVASFARWCNNYKLTLNAKVKNIFSSNKTAILFSFKLFRMRRDIFAKELTLSKNKKIIHSH